MNATISSISSGLVGHWFAKIGDGLVDIDPRRGSDAGARLFDVFSPVGTAVELVSIEAFQYVDHVLIDRSIAVAHLEKRSDTLLVEIIGHGGAGAVNAFVLGWGVR